MKYIIAIILLVPFLFTCVSYIVFAKLKMSKSKALGYAADGTTPLLMISIPVTIRSIWDIHSTFYFICVLLVIGIVLTVIEWRTKKEIQIPILLKKIWRIYFVLLSVLYILIICIGLVYAVVQYFQ